MLKIFLLIIFPLFAICQNKLDESAFEEYKFGTSPSEYKNLTLELDEGNSKLYSTTSPLLQINDVQVENFNLTFNKNKLSGIRFNTKNSTGTKLFETLKQKYGEPKKNNSTKGSFEWTGTKIQVVFETKPGSNDAVISVYGKEILKSPSKK